MKDIFGPLFAFQDKRLNKLGDPLKALEKSIDREAFRPTLAQVHSKRNESGRGNKPKDVVMMFKALVIQNLYGLSDDQLEYQIEDRRSFQRFLGLANHERTPDAKTYWTFRESLSRMELLDSLFHTLTEQLHKAGFVAKGGQIVDASIVRVPVQRNSREENNQIKQGDIPEDWEGSKRSQKDTDARWTKKHGKSIYGYKNHIQIDNKHKLIRNFEVSDASVHDSQVFEEILDPENSSAEVWADSAYRSKEAESNLRKMGYRSKVQHKGQSNKPLSASKRKTNLIRAKVRCRVEHVFAAQSSLRSKRIKCIGIARAQLAIGMMNLTYNMRRMCYLLQDNYA